ncbi:MAG: GNAT family N-acetyltransferase [Actinomycetes bacterium]
MIVELARVRPAWPADLAEVAGIYAHYVNETAATFDVEPPTRSEWSGRFWRVAEAGLPFLVAEVGRENGLEVAGFAYCSPWKPRRGYQGTVEDSIYVAPWATGMGVGSALMTQLLAACLEHGIRDVLAVIVDTGDPASVALHTRFGFAEVGRLGGVGAKLGRRWDTVLLQRPLG